MSFIAYRGDRTIDEHPLCITFEIPSDAITDLNRPSVKVKQTAIYRTNKAKVLKIEVLDQNKTVQYAESFLHHYYPYKNYTYSVGQYIDASNEPFNWFFLDKKLAEQMYVHGIQNGVYKTFREDGQKSTECNYVNGKQEGLWRSWHSNETICSEVMYVNGKAHGIHRIRYKNQKSAFEETYVHGVKHGPIQQWYETGQLWFQGIYTNGVLQKETMKVWDIYGRDITAYISDHIAVEKDITSRVMLYGY